MIQNRINSGKSQIALPKTETMYSNIYSYPAYQPLNFVPTEKLKIEQLKTSVMISSLTGTKNSSSIDREREILLTSGIPLSHMNSVIVKNDGKNVPASHILTDTSKNVVSVTAVTVPSHSSSPKLRVNDSHYLQSPAVKSYEYHHSPTQSPLQTTHSANVITTISNNINSHQLLIDSKLQHHRQQTSQSSTHHRQSPLPLTHHRQSTHHVQSPLPVTQQQSTQVLLHRHSPHSSIQTTNSSTDQRYGPSASSSLYQKVTSSETLGSYTYPTVVPQLPCVTAVAVTQVKPKDNNSVGSLIYGKLNNSINASTSSSRSQEVSVSSVSLHSKVLFTPSPYQQLLHHQLPPISSATPAAIAVTATGVPPPPAHTSRANTENDRYLYSTSSVNDLRQLPDNSIRTSITSEGSEFPNESSALSFQIQPLDLGIKGQLAVAEITKTKLEQRRMCDADDFISNETTVSNVISHEPSTFIADSFNPYDINKNDNNYNSSISVPTISEDFNIAPPISSSNLNTPIKVGPPMVDSEKSNSPKPPSYSGHKLKKAWLQRHSGGDISDEKISLTISTTPMITNIRPSNKSLVTDENDDNVSTNVFNGDRSENSNSPTTKEIDNCTVLNSLNNSLSNIGSMAVKSINKIRSPKSIKKSKEYRSSSVVLNGYFSPKASVINTDESSSSETETRTSPKHMLPKLKRKKQVISYKGQLIDGEEGPHKRKKLNSTSCTDSDKESASEKDSDNSVGKKTPSGGRDDKKDNRKRGRKPKVSGNYSVAGKPDTNSSEGPKEKKFRDESREQKDPFTKPPISLLKKTGESFLQDGPCFEVAPKLAKCRECRWTQNQRSKSNSNIFCRFYAFRRLRYTKNGQLAIAGFSDPFKDAKQV